MVIGKKERAGKSISSFMSQSLICTALAVILSGEGGRKPRVRFLRWKREVHWGESTILWSNLPITSWVIIFLPIQFSSVTQSCPTLRPHGPQDLSITNSQSLLSLMSIESVMPSNRLILCHPILLLPSVFPNIKVFSNESALHIRWPNYWSFSFNISPSDEHPGLISFRTDWLDLLAVQGTLKSLLQHHSSKASILRLSVFFIVWLSHPCMTTGKTTALTRWTFIGKIMSLLFIYCLGWS